MLSGVGGVVGAKERLLSRMEVAMVVMGGVGMAKGVSTGTRVVVRDDSWGLSVESAGRRLVRDRRLGVDWSRELKSELD